MQTKNQCRVCGKDIRPWVTICEDCRTERNYYAAIVSTNKKRLQKTLTERKLTRERLDKITIQSGNIIENWEVLLTFNGNNN